MKQPNRVKAAMRAGREAYGYNLSFPSPWVIDILGKLDFDFVFINGEHGPFGLDQLEDLCRTAERHNVTMIARVPDIGSSTILRYLDRGIMGILGPHIVRTIGRGTGALTRMVLPQANAYAMIRRRAAAAGIATKLGNHSFRATGITAYLKNGGTLEKAAAMANHASTRTTQLYDRRRDEVSLDEVERIVI
jgi:integrase